MKTHENRALFSRALLKATTCLFLTAGAGVSSVWAAPEENAQATSIVQQSSTVNGKITDANGEPIIGASVVIKGTTNGTITDFDGNFMLEVPAKATLVVSYVGYKTLEVSVNGKKTLNINLKEDTEMLDEVVVVGYGTQKKATLTGSVSQVGGEELKKWLQQILLIHLLEKQQVSLLIHVRANRVKITLTFLSVVKEL